MKQAKNQVSAMGLDVGTSRVVMAQRVDDQFQYESQLNAFVSIPFSKLTASVLDKEGVPHAVQGNEIIVHGNESERFAELMNAEMRRTMTKGTLDAKEPESLNIIRQIIASLAGSNAKDTQNICFTIPAPPLGAKDNLTYHESTVRQILSEMGYQSKPINEGLAVVYGELENNNYSGIGISFGGGLCNVAMAYLSVPIFSFSVPKGGDYIDSSAATVTGELANHIRVTKEASFHFNGFFADKLHQVIGVYYDDMIQSVVNGLKEALAVNRAAAKAGKALPVILSGGSTMPPGFRDRFEKFLRAEQLPIEISEVRMATSPLHTAAKGALVAMLAEL